MAPLLGSVILGEVLRAFMQVKLWPAPPNLAFISTTSRNKASFSKLRMQQQQKKKKFRNDQKHVKDFKWVILQSQLSISSMGKTEVAKTQ